MRKFIALLLVIITVLTPSIPVNASENYFYSYNGNSTSFVDGLYTIGADWSFEGRKKIAEINGITDYRGTPEQNEYLLNLLKNGKLIESINEDPYICYNYSQCTENNAEICIITKDQCAIRKEPHNGGEIVARGEIGQLISVNRIFKTPKNTIWCEINLIGSNEKLYVFMDNCTKHDSHSFVNLITTDNGHIDFCAVCGFIEATTDNDTTTCGIACISDQLVKGSFSTYDPSFVSIAAQIIVGELPGIGTIADARDLVGDIVNGESGWIIAADMVAFLPLVSAFKYSDEFIHVAKNSDDIATGIKHSDDAIAASYRILWGKWEDYPKITINNREYAEIGDFYYTEHATREFYNPSIETNQSLKIDPNTGKQSLNEHSRGLVPSYINWALTEGVALGLTKISDPIWNESAQAFRRTYTNGSLEIIVEADNIVITCMDTGLKHYK